jgi:nucleoid-associated protein YgaU
MSNNPFWLLLDVVIVFFGVILSRVVYRSIFKPSPGAAQAVSWGMGIIVAAIFYITWAQTGMEPLQLSICNVIWPSAPTCVERRRVRALIESASAADGQAPAGLPPAAPASAATAKPLTASEPAAMTNSVVVTVTVGPTQAAPTTAEEKPSCKRTHLVTYGETLLGIAATYGVEWNEIFEANDIEDPHYIQAGWELEIPAKCGQ